jgi:hypothetical protein
VLVYWSEICGISIADGGKLILDMKAFQKCESLGDIIVQQDICLRKIIQLNNPGGFFAV